MVTDDKATRERITSLLDELPDADLPDVMLFLERKQNRAARHLSSEPPYLPTPMGGLWQGAEFTEDDIAEERREMWGRFERLRAAVLACFEQAERGETIPYTPDLMDQLKQEARDNARAGRSISDEVSG